jgi:hypothetical protein
MKITGRSLRGTRFRIAMVIALTTVLLHLVVNLFFHYGIFRDELYYLACAKRPALGYVDHPPFGMWVLMLVRVTLGDGLFALRLLPALLHGATVFLAAVLTRRMGGNTAAVLLCCVAVSLAPIQLAMHGIYSMNSIEIALWPAAVLLFLGALEQPSRKRWLALGVLLGIMTLNKISALWLGLGMGAALLLPEHRWQLRTPWPWAAAVLALLLFSPYIFWNIGHDMAHLEFMRNASAHKYTGISRLDLLTQSVLVEGPLSVPLWIAGAMFYLGKAGRKWRSAGVLFAVAVLVLLVNGHSKAEYLASAFPVLFSAGAVMMGRAAARLARVLRASYAVLFTVTGILLLPLTLPVLSPPDFVRYSALLGVTHPNSEGKELHELPQYFADMHGWQKLARTVSAVYESLPEHERGSVIAVTDNYGEAGAIEYYAERYPLPPVAAPHNTYWWWSRDLPQAHVYLALARDDQRLRRLFTEVTVAATFHCEYCMPYENGLKVYVCRGVKVPFREMWEGARFYI